MKTSKFNGQSLTASQRQLVVTHLPLAENLSLKHAGLGKSKGIDYDDLYQEACLGLCEAALHYDPVKADSTFQTYAYNWCLGRVTRFITGEEYDGVDDEDVEGLELLDDSDSEVEANEQHALQVDALLGTLGTMERKIVCLVYGVGGSDPMDFRQIGRVLKIKTVRVRQIYDQALTKLQRTEDDEPQEYNVIVLPN